MWNSLDLELKRSRIHLRFAIAFVAVCHLVLLGSYIALPHKWVVSAALLFWMLWYFRVINLADAGAITAIGYDTLGWQLCISGRWMRASPEPSSVVLEHALAMTWRLECGGCRHHLVFSDSGAAPSISRLRALLRHAP